MERNSEIVLGLSCSPSLTVFHVSALTGDWQNEIRKQTNSLTRGEPSKWSKSHAKSPERRLHLVCQRNTKEPLAVNTDFPGGSVVKILPAKQKRGFDPWVWKVPWRREWLPIPVFLAAKSHGLRRLAGYSPRDHRVRPNRATQITNVQQ